jgi:hypothetical protein
MVTRMGNVDVSQLEEQMRGEEHTPAGMVHFWKVSCSFGAILGRRVTTADEIRRPSLTTAVYKSQSVTVITPEVNKFTK